MQLLVVPDCTNEQATRELLRRALREAGVGQSSIGIVVARSDAQAQEQGFAGSPTILLDGADAVPRAANVSGLACRMCDQPGGPHGVPELAALVAAIRRHEAAEPPAPDSVDRPATVPPGSAAAQAPTGIAAGR